MKKTIFLLIVAAMMSLTACNNSEVSPSVNILPTVQRVVGMTPEQAHDYLLKNGFTQADSWSSNHNHTVQYIKANADSSLVYRMTCRYVYDYESEGDTVIGQPVREYNIGLTISKNGYQNACKMYADWSNYAYNTIFHNVSVWSASVRESDSYSALPKTNYIDGSLKSEIKAIIDANHAEGYPQDEEYNYLMEIFAHDRSDFRRFLNGKNYLEGVNIEEGFAKLNGPSVPGEGGVLDQKGMVGRMETSHYSDGKKHFISFDFQADDWINDAVGPFYGPLYCQ